MKKFSFSILTTLSFLLFVTSLLAQKTGTPANTLEKESPAKVPYCDQVAENYGPDMQARANNECRTVYPCVPCLDRASSKKTCIQMVVQPNKDAKCAVKVSNLASPNANQAPPTLDQNDFTLSMIQTPCYFDGVSLQVLANKVGAPGLEPPGAYRYSWTVDDRPMGTVNSVYCVSGKTATVKVIQVATSRVKTLTVAIEKGVSDIQDKPLPVGNSVEKPIAVYQKTSCFGNCPSYIIEVYKDGTVEWNGYANISPLGEKKSKIGLDIYSKIEQKARAIDFLKLYNSYPEDKIEDAAATVIYMNLDGKEKQVRDVFGAPEGLVELEKMFDVMIQKLGWAKTNVKAPTKKKVVAQDNNNKASGN